MDTIIVAISVHIGITTTIALIAIAVITIITSITMCYYFKIPWNSKASGNVTAALLLFLIFVVWAPLIATVMDRVQPVLLSFFVDFPEVQHLVQGDLQAKFQNNLGSRVFLVPQNRAQDSIILIIRTPER